MRIFVLLTWAMAASAALADEGLFRCAAISDAAARLSCYDRLAAERKPGAAPNAINTPPRGTDVATTAPTARAPVQEKRASPDDAFGRQPSAAETTMVSRIQGRFEGWTPNAEIALANGQRWRVIDGSSVYVNLDNPAIKIRRGVLGSFYLEVEGVNQIARVRRIQ